jgi:hypothetical protein
MSRPCSIFFYAFLVLYLLALGLLLVGTFGWFGAEPDPLSGVFLIPLGLPWNRFLGGAPEALLPWLAAAAPLANLLLIRGFCVWLAARSA